MPGRTTSRPASASTIRRAASTAIPSRSRETTSSSKSERDLFAALDRAGNEQVVFCRDPATDLHAIIAIHDTTLGPGLGGIRMRHYDSEGEALTEVLRLSEAMTLKAS